MASIDPGDTPISDSLAGGQSRLKGRGQHTLDSDEEDEAAAEEECEAGVLPEEAIVGQEDGEACVDEEGVRFTAFNMREELEEGHFDAQGTYIFNKEAEIKDSWLDNIDWVQVKKVEGVKKTYGELGLGDSSSDEEVEEDKGRKSPHTARKEMLSFMRPGESVARSIKRLAGGTKGSSTLMRLKAKKKATKSDGAASNVDKDRDDMLQLSGLADGILSSGDMDIYQATYEKLAFMVENTIELREKEKNKTSTAAEFDMFADEDNGEPASKKSKVQFDVPATSADEPVTDEVKWEYKISQDSDTILGPYTSSQMLSWADSSDGFPRTTGVGVSTPADRVNEVFVRKKVKGETSTEQFYSSKRMDFDLYI